MEEKQKGKRQIENKVAYLFWLIILSIWYAAAVSGDNGGT